MKEKKEHFILFPKNIPSKVHKFMQKTQNILGEWRR